MHSVIARILAVFRPTFGSYLLAAFIAFSATGCGPKNRPRQKPQPPATPAPERQAEEPATPVPQPKVVAPSATPAPEPDALALLRSDKSRWPAEVRLKAGAEFPATLNGRIVGKVVVPAGTTVNLVDLTNDTVGVSYRGGGARLAIDATDLRERAKEAAAKPAAQLSPQSIPPKSATASVATTAVSSNAFPTSGSLIPMTVSGPVQKVTDLKSRRVTLTGRTELHVSGAGDSIAGSVFNFTSPDAWLFLDKLAPSVAMKELTDRVWVNGEPAAIGKSLRVTPFEEGTVVIPHSADFPAMIAFTGKSLTGTSQPLQCYVKYDNASLGAMKEAMSSFRLKRGYMATLASNEDGSGISKNFIAQDRDVEVTSLPPELDEKVRFVRIFPWRWVSKKGVAGEVWQDLNVGWYYDWNISQNSSPEIDYVPIRSKRGWPSLKQDWQARGSTHLLGFNEPDHKDQSNMTVDEAIASWPELLRTGLRLGSPAPSDGGTGWLFEFMDKANAAKLRVDFVAVHYYRAVGNPADAKGAASQFYNYLKGIHDRTKRPIWVTEWNNGANWTKAPDPNPQQQKDAIEEMIKMLDKTPFVERYAIYNWVEESRFVKRKDGSLTPAGEAYRAKRSPISVVQPKY